jgi:hypothetical protein
MLCEFSLWAGVLPQVGCSKFYIDGFKKFLFLEVYSTSKCRNIKTWPLMILCTFTYSFWIWNNIYVQEINFLFLILWLKYWAVFYGLHLLCSIESANNFRWRIIPLESRVTWERIRGLRWVIMNSRSKRLFPKFLKYK